MLFRISCLAIFLLSPVSLAAEKSKETKPNVVLLVIDTLRSDHLPFYGYSKNTAPYLSKLAKRSAIFENSYSTSSWTAPATASILTSLYPVQHGIRAKAFRQIADGEQDHFSDPQAICSLSRR